MMTAVRPQDAFRKFGRRIGNARVGPRSDGARLANDVGTTTTVASYAYGQAAGLPDSKLGTSLRCVRRGKTKGMDV